MFNQEFYKLHYYYYYYYYLLLLLEENRSNTSITAFYAVNFISIIVPV